MFFDLRSLIKRATISPERKTEKESGRKAAAASGAADPLRSRVDPPSADVPFSRGKVFR